VATAHPSPPPSTNWRKLALFQSGDLLCGLDIIHVQEINQNLAITVVHRAPEYVSGVVNLRGAIVTVIDLRKKFGFEPLPRDAETQIVIIRQGDENIGLLVDSVSDVVMAGEDDVEPPPSNLGGVAGQYFKGIFKQEDTLVAILNIDELLVRDYE
jgi:purine-binding chemotaxis protein CheW